LDNLGKFEAKGDEGYFIGYSMSNKAFRVFNKRTRKVEENLHAEFLENNAIKKGAGPNCKPQDRCSTEVPESSGNPNPTASTSNPPADQMETLTLESLIPTTLVDCHKGVRPIGTKWVLKNKKDERGIVMRNKAWLVSQGHTQEEGIDYDEDPEFLVRVYKVEKAMYGLHQAPRAWYGTLSKYLLTHGFQRGTIDQTLFIKRQRGDFILVQVYVDDIILGSSNPQLCREFEALMHEKFQMSAMGELNFFLGL
nr:hypothetical protein [Tanacetum cinerariifolium]